jgi:hypothetical protein
MKILGNWEKRQVIFLAEQDMQMIEQKIRDYIFAVREFADQDVSGGESEGETNEEIDFGES